VSKQIVDYPHGAQAYLHQTYGIRPYSHRHLNLMVQEGRFPRPFEVSPRRKGVTTEQLDRHAQAILAKADAAA
jgi:hypothetical protein